MIQVEMVERKWSEGSDKTFDCGLVSWCQGMGTLEVEFPVLDLDIVRGAVGNQTTNKEEKERLFEVWKDYQGRVELFLAKANAVIVACKSYSEDRQDWVTGVEDIKIPFGLSNDARKLEINIDSPIDLQVAQHMALALQFCPEEDYKLQQVKGNALAVNVSLHDGTVLQNCRVVKDDIMVDKVVIDKEDMENCFAMRPWGNKVRKMKLQGIETKLEIIIDPTMVKDWSYTEEN
ncbi:hypothetical protein [Bacillus thuringiensis]|uniref:hypothetical protein n=1 Tax=Bacillus thuringiensis TaxID=1428 RepID=UPI000BFE632C|nr:hypothetical protein [Bacillus thuringiensis]PGT89866.1 hypothetical protein COD17_08945 [Bacillus thuringiensis]